MNEEALNDTVKLRSPAHVAFRLDKRGGLADGLSAHHGSAPVLNTPDRAGGGCLNRNSTAGPFHFSLEKSGQIQSKFSLNFSEDELEKFIGKFLKQFPNFEAARSRKNFLVLRFSRIVTPSHLLRCQ